MQVPECINTELKSDSDLEKIETKTDNELESDSDSE